MTITTLTYPLRYVAPFWSQGDRFELVLDFPDEPTLRRELAPLGLEAIADIKIGDGEIVVDGLPIFVDVFGPMVTIIVGPEDRYEHMTDAHRVQAEAIAKQLRERGLDRFAIEPIELGFGNAAPRRLPPMRGPLAACPSLARATLELPAQVLGRALVVMRDVGLSCRFGTRKALAELGSVDAAFAFVLSELDLALAAAGKEERMWPIYIGDETLPRWVLLRETERDRMFADGLASTTSASLEALRGVVEESLARVVALPAEAVMPRVRDLAEATLRQLLVAKVESVGELAVRAARIDDLGYPVVDDVFDRLRETASLDVLSDAARVYLEQLADEDFFVAARRIPHFPMPLVGRRLASMKPLDAFAIDAYRAVVLPTPNVDESPSGGVMVNGRDFLHVGVAPRFLGRFAEHVVAAVPDGEGLWPIVIDVKRRASSIGDDRLRTDVVGFVGIDPAAVTVRVGDGSRTILRDDIVWTPLDRTWAPPKR